jgi:hypothetical protein
MHVVIREAREERAGHRDICPRIRVGTVQRTIHERVCTPSAEGTRPARLEGDDLSLL